MNARTQMTHRANIQRDARTGRDGYNQNLPPDWQPLGTFPCYAWFPVEHRAEDSVKTANVSKLNAMMPLATDVTERDRILNITNRLNIERFTGPLAIETIIRKPDHLLLELRRVA